MKYISFSIYIRITVKVFHVITSTMTPIPVLHALVSNLRYLQIVKFGRKDNVWRNSPLHLSPEGFTVSISDSNIAITGNEDPTGQIQFDFTVTQYLVIQEPRNRRGNVGQFSTKRRCPTRYLSSAASNKLPTTFSWTSLLVLSAMALLACFLNKKDSIHHKMIPACLIESNVS